MACCGDSFTFYFYLLSRSRDLPAFSTALQPSTAPRVTESPVNLPERMSESSIRFEREAEETNACPFS
jgi:hypothetical protein